MTLPIPVDPPPAKRAGRRRPRVAADYAAQVLGQGESRRGLKGGPETLDAARTAYLSTEYSGDHDRRPKAGLIKREEV